MGSTSRSGRATINPNAPEALGICDGCGFMFNLRTLQPQMRWAGTTLVATGYKKCGTCLDVPNEQFRTIILPPDPPPIDDVRPEQLAIDQRNDYTLRPTFSATAEILITLVITTPEVAVRITELSDRRITEAGDVRITE